jgi:hypothetical protein
MIGAGLPPMQVTPNTGAGGVAVWITLAVVLAMFLVFVASIWVSAYRMRRVGTGLSAPEPKLAESSDRLAA